MKTFRLIRSKPAGAYYNMRLDEKIFFHYLDERLPVLRIYSWDRPSFTYGISQNPEDGLDMGHCLSHGIEVARRMTGGGILFHNNEITYSFACSKEDVGEGQKYLVSYKEICAFLIRFYGSLGLKASFAQDSPGFNEKSAPHRICGASYEKYDIMINGRKIGGNAQKRNRHAVFQHGSIPYRIDWELARRYVKPFPEDMPSGVTTLSDELRVLPGNDTMEKKLIEAFGSEFGVCFKEDNESLYETVMVK